MGMEVPLGSAACPGHYLRKSATVAGRITIGPQQVLGLPPVCLGVMTTTVTAMPSFLDPLTLVGYFGTWALVGLLVVVFIESGVLFPVLPGDPRRPGRLFHRPQHRHHHVQTERTFPQAALSRRCACVLRTARPVRDR